jgi:hypothetical protein
MTKQPVQWKKRILLPIWFIRICAMLFICVVFGMSITWAKDNGFKPVLGYVSYRYSIYTKLIIPALSSSSFSSSLQYSSWTSCRSLCS